MARKVCWRNPYNPVRWPPTLAKLALYIVCCAWDLYISMGADSSDQPTGLEKIMHEKELSIPVVFVTMLEGTFIRFFCRVAHLYSFLAGPNTFSP